jgi:RES domain-containing protein
MLVYRICLAKYASSLKASGRAARWNPNEVEMIYTAGSRSLACLENVVHRNQIGLSMAFKVMTIDIPDDLLILSILKKDLIDHWSDFQNIPVTQHLGEKWILTAASPVCKVPSSIIEGEYNYLLNPNHPKFKSINLLKSEPFVFDKRIKAL